MGDFVRLVRPAFNMKIHTANLEAILERTHILVNTKDHLVMRLALSDCISVISWPLEGSYLSRDAINILENFYMRGQVREGFKELVLKEQQVFKELMHKDDTCKYTEPTAPVGLRVVPATPENAYECTETVPFDASGDYMIPYIPPARRTSGRGSRFRLPTHSSTAAASSADRAGDQSVTAAQAAVVESEDNDFGTHLDLSPGDTVVDEHDSFFDAGDV
eukprot:12142625-Karenia_brevis.AAC.1